MMQVLVILCGITLVYALPATTIPPEGAPCKTQSDCPYGECCVHNPLSHPGSRKRFLFEQYSQHDHGFCRRARKETESCWPLGHDPSNSELFEFYCPCESGLECRGLVVHESATQIIHERPQCQNPENSLTDTVTYSGQTCMSDADCSEDMCCVFHPDTLRQEDQGYCRAWRQRNETCTASRTASLGTARHTFECPCKQGLQCRGTQVQNIGGQINLHVNPVCQTPTSG
ncbi:uncharacterized protein LOC127831908 [Dreissena polymorpha]|uniref:Uncharacterized protein n=1 Tax=Dreissena polymorpha TaxID=45954 RepID=A0A9D4GST7_DREPO|nr:uncharacterized protein LOC127831908 [Dreissena polymorpha]KAH3819317.1 hypothetical protein DPMN_121050 [Dreissena polymorpha]